MFRDPTIVNLCAGIRHKGNKTEQNWTEVFLISISCKFSVSVVNFCGLAKMSFLLSEFNYNSYYFCSLSNLIICNSKQELLSSLTEKIEKGSLGHHYIRQEGFLDIPKVQNNKFTWFQVLAMHLISISISIKLSITKLYP